MVADHPVRSSIPTHSSDPAPDSGTTFASLGVEPRFVQALSRGGVVTPFPIQAATLPDALAGRDVLGRGATGSGKSLAFLLPVVTRLARIRPARPRRPRALVLAPTRELAAQLSDTLAPLTSAAGLRHVTIFGGVPAGAQVRELRRGVDIIIACPGRLLDHLSSGAADLGHVEITVLDEADHMADLGFLRDVRRILDRTPSGSQRLLFSATLDAGVDVLVKQYLDNPVVHRVADTVKVEDRIEHRVVRVDRDSRLGTIAELAASPGRVVVFTRTKRGAKRLARQLVVRGVLAVDLHGDLSQGARRRNLAAFSDGSVSTLVATDIAARGIHVDDVALVVHADPPADHKAYVHRSGRTGRAGATGTVVTVALDEQLAEVKAMARKASVATNLDEAPTGSASEPARRTRSRGSRRRGRGARSSQGRPSQGRSTDSPRTSQSSQPGPGQGPRRARTHSAAAFSASRRPR